ncbi:MAG: hypothetical protein WCP95_04175 [Actinomycetes bacterium]
MTVEQGDWRDSVRAAALAGHEDELRRLFAEAALLFGPDASAEWARTLSALDGNAITG